MRPELQESCPPQQLKQNSILLRERLALYVAFVILASLAWQTMLGAAAARRCQAPQSPCRPVDILFFEVGGAVCSPGWYRAEKGTSYAVIFEQSGLTADADLSNIDLTKPLHKPCKIVVPARRSS